MKSVIVTGASGFVGSNLVEELASKGYEVFALVRREDAPLPTHENVKKILCSQENILFLPDLLPQKEFSACYHVAWAGSSKAEERVDAFLQLDQIKNTLNTLKAMKKIGCPRVICTGSIMEEEVIANIQTQGSRPSMAYVYGAGKLTAHAMAQSVAHDLGLELLWVQITNTYGVGEKSQRMVNSTLRKCSQGEAPQFTSGTQNYDFIYITDVARALGLVGEKGIAFTTYLLGSGTARPLKEFLMEMKEAVAPNLDFLFGDVPFTGVNLPLMAFDTAKLKEDTGFVAEISFGEGCKLTKRWLEENET